MAQTLLSLATLLTVAAAGEPTADPAPLTGSVTYYAPYVMEATYKMRLQWGHVAPCGQCVGKLALLDRRHLGRRVWLQRPGHPVEGPYLVVDCAAGKDRERLRKRGLVAEVDWPTAQRWRMAGPIDDVTIWFADPERAQERAPAPDEVPHPTGLPGQSRRRQPH